MLRLSFQAGREKLSPEELTFGKFCPKFWDSIFTRFLSLARPTSHPSVQPPFQIKKPCVGPTTTAVELGGQTVEETVTNLTLNPGRGVNSSYV
jgi:hypothetical protein